MSLRPPRFSARLRRAQALQATTATAAASANVASVFGGRARPSPIWRAGSAARRNPVHA